MEEKMENLWHKSWSGFSAPQIYLEDMERTSYETVFDSEEEEEYFSCLEDIDMEDDSGEAEIQKKGSITIQSGHNLLCALSQRDDHGETMGPCPSEGIELDMNFHGRLSQIIVPEVNVGTGPTRDTEDNVGHGPSQSTDVNVTYGASMSQNAVPEVDVGTGPTTDSEGTIGDDPSQGKKFNVSFSDPMAPCLYPEDIIIPGPPWEREESLHTVLSQREEREDTEGILPSPNVDHEDNLHGETNQNSDRRKRWRLKGVRRQIHRLCCCFFCCLLTPTEEDPTPRSEEQAWGHGS